MYFSLVLLSSDLVIRFSSCSGLWTPRCCFGLLSNGIYYIDILPVQLACGCIVCAPMPCIYRRDSVRMDIGNSMRVTSLCESWARFQKKFIHFSATLFSKGKIFKNAFPKGPGA